MADETCAIAELLVNRRGKIIIRVNRSAKSPRSFNTQTHPVSFFLNLVAKQQADRPRINSIFSKTTEFPIGTDGFW
jgi:hypothetical protein